MALTECVKCRTTADDSAQTCPHCRAELSMIREWETHGHRRAQVKVILHLVGIIFILALPFSIADWVKEHQRAEAEAEQMGHICYPEYTPSEGKLIIDGIQAKYKNCDLSPMLVGVLGEQGCLAVFIPTDEYASLSSEEKKRIINYASSLVPDAKLHPSRYMNLSPNAPVFRLKLMERHLDMLNYRSCAIVIGPIIEGLYYATGTGTQIYGKYVDEKRRIYPYDPELL